MAADERLSSIATQQVFDEIAAIKTGLKDISDAIAAARALEINLKGAGNIKDAVTATDQLSGANRQLQTTIISLSKATEDYNAWKARSNGTTTAEMLGTGKVIRLNIQAAKEIEARARAEKAQSAARLQQLREENSTLKQNEDAYGRLAKQYNEAQRAAKNLAVQHGVESKAAMDAAKAANELSNQLKKIDATVGQHQRNVGNYASAFNGLGFSIRNIASELPNLGISIRTFAQSISNNIGPLSQSIKEARLQNAALVAEGKPVVSIGKQIAQSVFSWQTAILAVVAAGTALITYLTKKKGALGEAEKANERYKKSIEGVAESERASAQTEIAHANVLAKIASDTTQTMKNRMRAVKELMETYPDRFGALTKEAILEGRVADALRATTQELLNKAAAQAAEKRFGFASERVYDLTLAQRRAQLELNKALVEYNKLSDSEKNSRGPDSGPEAGRGGFGLAASIKDNYIKARDAVTGITEQLRIARLEQQGFLNDAKNSAAQAGSTIFSADPKPKSTKAADAKAARDEAARIKQELEDQAAAIRTVALDSKKLADDESKSLAERLNAYQQYATHQTQAVLYKNAAEKKTEAETKEDLKKILIEWEEWEADLTKKYNDAEVKAAKEQAKTLADIETAKWKKIAQDLKGDKMEDKGEAKVRDIYLRAGLDVGNELTKLIDIASKKKLDAIDKEIAAINRRRDAEIEAIEKAGGSDDERAKKKEDAIARASAQEAVLNERRTKQQRKDAQIAKDINIAKIIAETALAVIHQYTTGDPYSQFARAFAAGAVGAAQLAVAIATPIPQFAKGTDHSPEGLAIVGERGPEGRINPDGSVDVTPGIPTLTYLKKGTKIIPNDELMQLAMMYSAVPVMGQAVNNNNLERAMDKQTAALVEVIKNKKETQITFQNLGIQHLAKIGNSQLNYLHNNF